MIAPDRCASNPEFYAGEQWRHVVATGTIVISVQTGMGLSGRCQFCQQMLGPDENGSGRWSIFILHEEP